VVLVKNPLAAENEVAVPLVYAYGVPDEGLDEVAYGVPDKELHGLLDAVDTGMGITVTVEGTITGEAGEELAPTSLLTEVTSPEEPEA
jgi:hypothetical protein